MRWPDKP